MPNVILWYDKPEDMKALPDAGFVAGELALRAIHEAIYAHVKFTYHPPTGGGHRHGIEVDALHAGKLTVACRPSEIQTLEGEKS